MKNLNELKSEVCEEKNGGNEAFIETKVGNDASPASVSPATPPSPMFNFTPRHCRSAPRYLAKVRVRQECRHARLHREDSVPQAYHLALQEGEHPSVQAPTPTQMQSRPG